MPVLSNIYLYALPHGSRSTGAPRLNGMVDGPRPQWSGSLETRFGIRMIDRSRPKSPSLETASSRTAIQSQEGANVYVNVRHQLGRDST